MKRFYRFEFFRAFSSGFISPFITLFALALGASNILLGYLNASIQFSYIIMQLIISYFLLRQRKFGGGLTLFIATLSWSLMWIIIGRSSNPFELILFLSIQAIFSAAITLSWTSMLVNTIPSYKRGRTIAEINRRSVLGSMLATMISGYFIKSYGFIQPIFLVPTIFGIFAAFQFFSLSYMKEKYLIFPKQKFDYKYSKDFKLLIVGRALLNFAVGLAAPFLSVYVVTALKGNAVDVAIISFMSSLTYILFYRPWGFVVDFIGRRITMLSCVLLIATIPLCYALTPSVFLLYFLVVIGSMGWAGFEIASFSYFSDFAKKSNVFQITSIYNSSIEVATILGNIVGGFLAHRFGIFKVFLLSFILRFGCLGFFSELSEKKGSTNVKINTTFQPIRYIEESATLYLILFSTFKRNIKKDFFERIERIVNDILKLIKR
ncbi:MAG: MFS transporter [Candidatus Aenigmatarchaeota archaeon]